MRNLLSLFMLSKDQDDHIGLVSIRSNNEPTRNSKNKKQQETDDGHRWLKLIRD